MLLSPWRKLRVRTTICVDLSYVVDAVHQVPVTHSDHCGDVRCLYDSKELQNCFENVN